MALPVKQRFTEGDTDATVQFTCKRNGSVLNLTGYTAVKFYARKKGGAALAVIDGTIDTPLSGLVSFDLTTVAAAQGAYVCQIRTTNASSKVRRCDPFQVDVIEPVETSS